MRWHEHLHFLSWLNFYSHFLNKIYLNKFNTNLWAGLNSEQMHKCYHFWKFCQFERIKIWFSTCSWFALFYSFMFFGKVFLFYRVYYQSINLINLTKFKANLWTIQIGVWTLNECINKLYQMLNCSNKNSIHNVPPVHFCLCCLQVFHKIINQFYRIYYQSINEISIPKFKAGPQTV